MAFFGRETIVLDNGALSLEVLRDGGPRLVRMIPGGTKLNLLAEVPDATAATPWGPYSFLGGHRLWHAPEALPRSYDPEDSGVTVTVNGLDMMVQGPVEAHTGIRKSIRFMMDSKQASVRVEHRMENQGVWPVELAAWAITQLRLGGVAILPLRKPGSYDGLLADRQVAIWPYADLADPRLHLGNARFLVEGKPSPNAFKIGVYNKVGWEAYLYGEYLFIKRFDVVPGKFADYGCNAEVYVRDAFIEVESQGPMTLLEPGAGLLHVEEWEIRTVKAGDAEGAIQEAGLDL
jgi:hypothetical protein